MKSTAFGALALAGRAQSKRPNVVMIYADDLGYGDVGCYGSYLLTPNLDRMAQEGIRFTDFYSASAVCSPSRAALLTGRYPLRVGVPRVMDPSDPGGINRSETTLAEMLQREGYATCCVGKWHLGTEAGYRPMDRGFGDYFGIPYSNDMSPRVLVHNTDVIEETAKLDTLTQRYTEYALNFIRQSKDQPFFLYFPHTFPHIPVAASARFRGQSGQGAYGDAVQELDWSVGQVLQGLKDAGLDDNTLVMFSSDNGPWYQGSAGRLRGRKGETWEGGMRVPFIARFPSRIAPGQVATSMATTMDILPTVANLCGTQLPAKPLDGVDIWPLLTGVKGEFYREPFLYFNDHDLQCARLGPWKLHLARLNVPLYTPIPAEGRCNLPLPNPELYDLTLDPQEAYDRAERNPQVSADIRGRVDRLIRTFNDDVVGIYERTLVRKVVQTPAGALPVELAP